MADAHERPAAAVRDRALLPCQCEADLQLPCPSNQLRPGQKDYPTAIAWFEKAVSLSDKIGDQYQNLWAHVHMATSIYRQGDIQQARTLFSECIRKTYEANFMIALVYAVEGVASLNLQQGRSECAASLYAWADAMRKKIGDHHPPVDQALVDRDMAIIHSKLDEVEFEKLTAEGRAMTTEQAIALALDE